MFHSVAPGRPKQLNRPPGGSERGERGGMFHSVAPGRPKQLNRPPGGGEHGGLFHCAGRSRRTTSSGGR